MFDDVRCPAIVHGRSLEDETEEILRIVVGNVIHFHAGDPMPEKIPVSMVIVEYVDRIEDESMHLVSRQQ